MASARAFGTFGKETGTQVSAFTIWVNKPVDEKSPPIFAPVGSENNGEGLTLSDFCDYVVANKATPWPCKEQNEGASGLRPHKPTLAEITEFCTTLVNNDYMFTLPAGRGQHQGGKVARRNVATDEKKPGF